MSAFTLTMAAVAMQAAAATPVAAPAPSAPAPAAPAGPAAPGAPAVASAAPVAPTASIAAPAATVTTHPVAVAPPVADAAPEAPVPSGPVESRFDVRLDLDTVWYTKQSFDFFSSHDASVVPGISVGYAVFHAEPISLVPELGFSANGEDASGLFAGALTHTSLASKNVYGGLSVRWDLLSFFDVAARLSGGASFVHVEVEPSISNAAPLKDDGTSPFMTVGGGFTVHTPARTFQTRTGGFRSLIAGLAVESGYVLAGAVDLTPSPSGDQARIKTTYLSLGRLDRSGPYIKTSLTVRF